MTMKAITGIGGTLLLASLLTPIAGAQERAAKCEIEHVKERAPSSLCAGPYNGRDVTQKEITKLLDDSPVNHTPLNFCGARLAKLDLNGANLNGANFNGADLSEADLNNASLGGANLNNADLRCANLSGAVLQPAQLVGANLTRANLSAANLNDADLSKAVLKYANLRKALLRNTILTGANLSGADLRETNLNGANLSGANLSGADLSNADLRDAKLNQANLSWADLSPAVMSKDFFQPNVRRYTNLSEAKLGKADLSGADLSKADLTGADLNGADMNGTLFEPQKPPGVEGLAYALHLSDMIYMETPFALVTLREAFKKAGFREQERQVTYAIKRRDTAYSWPHFYDQHSDPRLPGEKPSQIENGLNFVLFDMTTQWGMTPSRSLKILVCLIFVFCLPYAIALKRQAGDRQVGGGIWMVWLKERVLPSEGTDVPDRVKEKGLRLLWTAFYFSLLSAFNIGFREINVGNWLFRLQSHEYTLRATGWVRTVSGIQSLISVYMVALWVLTYFGRPFE
jgi:uncharacterized protein YjbI with pentapeptide repeats